MSQKVTASNKCYIFLCCGCGLLAQSDRSDAITCSPACRVMAHRTGMANEIREMAAELSKSCDYDISAGLIQQFKAIKALIPEAANEMIMGKRRLRDPEIRDQMNKLWLAKLAGGLDERS